MVKRIDKLTPEQAARVASWAHEWIDIGLCTDPADRPRAEAALRKCYEYSGLAEPRFIIWVGSPWAMACAVAPAKLAVARALNTLGSVDSMVHAQVGDQIRAQVYDQVDAQVYDQIRAQVYAQVYAQVNAQVGDQVHAQVHAQIRAQVYAQVNAQVYDQVGAKPDIDPDWHRYLGGQFWAWWSARERYYAEVCGLELHNGMSDRGAAYAELTRTCGWIWPHCDFAICVERPARIHRNQSNLLHCDHAAAVEFRDGWGVYALNGTRVPREWIEQRDTVDPKLALTHPNIEQRRELRTLLGWPRILEAVGSARLIHGDPTTHLGAVIELDLQDDDGRPARFLHARCPSGRDKQVVERIDPRCNTAIEAQAWRLGKTVEQYRSGGRT